MKNGYTATYTIRSSRKDSILTNSFYILVSLYTLICLYPLLLAFSVAFSDETAVSKYGYSLLPQKPTLDTFKYLLSQRMEMIINAYGVTILVTVAGVLVSLMVTVMYAYSSSAPGFRHRDKFSFFAYFTMLFNGGMLPWYILCTKYYHLSNQVIGLILPYAMNVFNMFLMKNYLKTIPDELYEAARIDGAGNFRIFFAIILPLSQVGLVTIGLFYGLGYWNDFYLPLMLISKDKLYTIQFLLYRMMSNITFLATNSTNSMTSHVQPPMQTARMAMSVLAIGPIIFLYPFVQKYFVKGIVLGAVKG